MEKKILVAIDDSENARRAVEFVANLFTSDTKVTLFSVLQDTAALCEMNSPALTPYFTSQQSSFCLLEEKKKELVNEALKTAQHILIEAGFEEKNIAVKSDFKKRGVARDIIKESQAGYDVIVLGRKGLSGIQDFFLGSVSQKVFNSAKDVSVLVVN
ncbi:universal stress protein [Thermodesulfobacteriota bacterium]